MSLIYVTPAWQARLSDPIAKLVLMSLADQSNDDGICWPSIMSIMRRTEISERSVQIKLSYLHKIKLLERKIRPGHSTVYFLNLENIQKLVPPKAQKSAAHTPAPDAPPPPHQMHPTPAPRAPRTVIEPSVINQGENKKITYSPEAKPRVHGNPKFGGNGEKASLYPTSPAQMAFFAGMAKNFRAAGRKPPERFPTFEAKEEFEAEEKRLGDATIKKAVSAGQAKGIQSVTGLIAWVKKWGKSQPAKPAMTPRMAAIIKSMGKGEELSLPGPKEADGIKD